MIKLLKIAIIILIVVVVAVIFLVAAQHRAIPEPPPEQIADGDGQESKNNQTNMARIEIERDIQDSGLQLTSPLFGHNGVFPADCTYDGKEMNPPLEIAQVPDNAKSLALILSDPDAPSGTYYHWVVWNIDPDTQLIAADSVPKDAVQGLNSGRQNLYFGPCPPSGTHRYYFDLYALDVKLNLPEATTGPQLKAAMEGHIIDQTQLMARYR